MDMQDFFEKLNIIRSAVFEKSEHDCTLKIDSFTNKNIVFELEYIGVNTAIIPIYIEDHEPLVTLAVDIEQHLNAWGYDEWCIGEQAL